MFELRKLDLELAFETCSALREDIENEAVAVEDAHLEQRLEVALLARSQGAIDENEFRARLVRELRDLFGLARADEEPGIRPCEPRANLADDIGAGRQGERAKLLDFVGPAGTADADVQ